MHLQTAVEAFEKAVEMRQAAEAEADALRRQVEAAHAAQRELTTSLGAERARVATLESCYAEVCQRLDAAIETIKTLLSAS